MQEKVCSSSEYNFCTTLVLVVLARPEVLVPESVDDSQYGESRGDEDEALVLRGRPLRRHVLVLAPLEHRLVDAVQAKGVRVRYPIEQSRLLLGAEIDNGYALFLP